MEPVAVVVTLAVAAVVVAAAVLLARRQPGRSGRRGRRGDRRPGGVRVPPGAERTVVTLDVEVADPGSPSVGRLTQQLASELFRQQPGLEAVEVRDRAGRVLAVVAGPTPSRGTEPPGPRGPSGRAGEVRRDGELELADRDPHATGSLRRRFELPAPVSDRLPEEPTLAELLRAMLEAAGHTVVVSGDVLRAGEEAVVALGATDPESLNAAFLRYRASGARRGLALALRDVHPREVQRREQLAPDLRYGGPAAIQRMADAVAVGADPLRFALGPPTIG